MSRPRDPSHGDVACNIAMKLAKQLKMNPREMATKVVEALLANPAGKGLVESVDIAGPGFINLRVTAAAKQTVIKAVLAQGAAYGNSDAGAGKSVIIEFVSANPTGPLHVGHKPGDAAWPESAYNGDYIAADFSAKKTVSASDGTPAAASVAADRADRGGAHRADGRHPPGAAQRLGADRRFGSPKNGTRSSSSTMKLRFQ